MKKRVVNQSEDRIQSIQQEIQQKLIQLRQESSTFKKTTPKGSSTNKQSGSGSVSHDATVKK